MARIAIYGAGGHGREVAEILSDEARAGSDLKLEGFIDDRLPVHAPVAGNCRVLGTLKWFDNPDHSQTKLIVAVGDPLLVKELTEGARKREIVFARATSPSSHVSSNAYVGDGAIVFPGVVVQPDVEIGDHVTLNVAATVSHDTVVGRYANINPGAHLAGNVTVGEGAFIGMGANVIQGITIGQWATVGAGAVVLEDIPPYATVVGVPARVIKTRESTRETQ